MVCWTFIMLLDWATWEVVGMYLEYVTKSIVTKKQTIFWVYLFDLFWMYCNWDIAILYIYIYHILFYHTIIYLFIYLFIYLSIYLSICLSIYLYVYLYICLYIYIYPSIYPSIHPSIYIILSYLCKQIYRYSILIWIYTVNITYN